jgi:hypothetical protein
MAPRRNRPHPRMTRRTGFSRSALRRVWRILAVPLTVQRAVQTAVHTQRAVREAGVNLKITI